MTDVLADYLGIYNLYPVNALLSKTQRKARHSALMKWSEREYQIMPDIEEIIAFIKANDSLKYERPFFQKVINPCVHKDVETGGIQSIRFLFEYNRANERNIGTDRDCLYYCGGEDFRYNPLYLADLVLSSEPDNEIVLNYKYNFIKCILGNSVHEIPWGVLSGMNGAEKEDIPYMNENLNTFISLSKRLCKDDKWLIQECTVMYAAWEQYLDRIENYNSFEDYLIQHNVPY